MCNTLESIAWLFLVDMNKCLFILIRITLTDQRKNPTEIYLGEPISVGGLVTGQLMKGHLQDHWWKVTYRSMKSSKAAASLKNAPKMRNDSQSFPFGVPCSSYSEIVYCFTTQADTSWVLFPSGLPWILQALLQFLTFFFSV